MKKTRSNIFRDIYYQPYDDSTRLKLYTSSKASLQLIQRMSLLKRLKVHNGCVNSICWNSTGDLILSGSDDRHLVLTNAYSYEVLTDYKTSHRANIFSAKFLPNSGDHHIVSCNGDGMILYTDLTRQSETFHNQFKCHNGTTYEIATIPGDPHTFLSCGEDGTVRLFDLRIKYKCTPRGCREDVLISCQRAVTALSVNPVLPHQIAIGCSDSTVRTFDTRMLGTPATGWTNSSESAKPLCSLTVPEFEGNPYRITSLSYSPDGQDVLVSYSSDHLYLFSVKDQGSVQLRKDTAPSKSKGKKNPMTLRQQVRRLRLRGDWSDTGPDARPEREGGRRRGTEIAQARPILHASLMDRMMEVLSRMLNDPATRAALSSGGEDSLEAVIEQQENTQNNNEGTAEPTEGRSGEPSGQATAQTDNNQTVETAEAQTDRHGETSTNETESEPGRSTSGVAEPRGCDLSSTSATTDQTPNGNPVETESNVPKETESSQADEQTYSARPTSSRALDESSVVEKEGESNNSASCTSMDNKPEGGVVENLEGRPTMMRDSFHEKDGSEPAVSLSYSDKSSTSAKISHGPTDEMIRDSYHAGPSGSRSCESRSADSGRSHDKHLRFADMEEKTDDGVFTDSDDEDTPRERLVNPVEAEMDEAIANARSLQGHENFDETCLIEQCVKQKYMGHRNARTMIKEANFWGDDFVMSGSDCGHVFVWERDTARLCMLLEADQHVVNCLQPHPFLPMLATSGVDYDVKLWAPINEESSFDEQFAEDLTKRNAVMLDETKDIITVPAVLMVRMLACLNQIRRGRRRNRRTSGDETGELRGG